MKAVICERFGPPHLLALKDVPSPSAPGASSSAPRPPRDRCSVPATSRPPAARPRGRRQRLRLDHGRLLEVLLVLRGAVHARRGGQPPLRRRAHRSGRPGRLLRRTGATAHHDPGHPLRPGRPRRLRGDADSRQRDRRDRAEQELCLHSVLSFLVVAARGGRRPARTHTGGPTPLRSKSAISQPGAPRSRGRSSPSSRSRRRCGRLPLPVRKT